MKIKIHHEGFTLVELLIVISIIALLSSVVLSTMTSARSKARDAERVAEIKALQNALELHRVATGIYPPIISPIAVAAIGTGPSGAGSMTLALFSLVNTTRTISEIPTPPAPESTFYAYANRPQVLGTCNGYNSNTFSYVLYFLLENDNTRFQTGTISAPAFTPAAGYYLKCIAF